MNAEAMDAPAADQQQCVQQAATLEAVHRHVVVGCRLDREARQDRIAMVAMFIHRIARVMHLGPVRAREVRALLLLRPVGKAFGVPRVAALHFLQEHDIRLQCIEFGFDIMHDHAPVERRQAFVQVETGDRKRVLHEKCLKVRNSTHHTPPLLHCRKRG